MGYQDVKSQDTINQFGFFSWLPHPRNIQLDSSLLLLLFIPSNKFPYPWKIVHFLSHALDPSPHGTERSGGICRLHSYPEQPTSIPHCCWADRDSTEAEYVLEDQTITPTPASHNRDRHTIPAIGGSYRYL